MDGARLALEKGIDEPDAGGAGDALDLEGDVRGGGECGGGFRLRLGL
jgi:hypothetical protein